MLSHLQRLYVALIAPPRDDRGATAAEYGLLIGVIAFVIIGGITIFGDALSDFFERIATWVGGWNPGDAPDN